MTVPVTFSQQVPLGFDPNNVSGHAPVLRGSAIALTRPESRNEQEIDLKGHRTDKRKCAVSSFPEPTLGGWENSTGQTGKTSEWNIMFLG